MDDLDELPPTGPDADLVRRPLLTLTEARDVVALLQELGESGSESGWFTRDLAARLAMRLPAGE